MAIGELYTCHLEYYSIASSNEVFAITIAKFRILPVDLCICKSTWQGSFVIQHRQYIFTFMHRIICTMSVGPTLKVRSASNEVEETHNCEWAPFSCAIQGINWLPLATSQVTFPNILLHELKEEASLELLITTVQSMPSTKALLLINTNNSDEKFYLRSEKPSVPTLVVGEILVLLYIIWLTQIPEV